MGRAERETGKTPSERRSIRTMARVRQIETRLNEHVAQDHDKDLTNNPNVVINVGNVEIHQLDQLNVLSPDSLHISSKTLGDGQQSEQLDTEVSDTTDGQVNIVDGAEDPGQRPGGIRRTIASLTSRIPRPIRRAIPPLLIVGGAVLATRATEHFWPQPGRVEPGTKTPSASSATPTPNEAGVPPTPTLVPTDEIGTKSPILITPTLTPTSTPKTELTATPRPPATPELPPSPTPKSDKQTDREIIYDPSGTTLKEGTTAVIKTINHNNLTITIKAIKLSEPKTLGASDKDSWIEEEGSHGYADINAAVLAACETLRATRQSLQSKPSDYLPPSPLGRYNLVLIIPKGYTGTLPPDCKPQ